MADETSGAMLARLGTDGEKWAEELLDLVPPSGRASVDTMRAWFANAIEVGRSAGYADAKREIDPEWPGSIADGDPVMVFRRSEIIQYLGQWALPPWREADGRWIGGTIDCAVLGAKLVAALEAIDLTRRVPEEAASRG